jgi:hypothetical protein
MNILALEPSKDVFDKVFTPLFNFLLKEKDDSINLNGSPM